jgi:hypothetical protein
MPAGVLITSWISPFLIRSIGGRPAFLDLGQLRHLDPVVGQNLGGAAGGVERKAKRSSSRARVDRAGLVGVLDRKKDISTRGQSGFRRRLGLGEGDAEILVEPHDLARGPHLGPEHDRRWPGNRTKGKTDSFTHQCFGQSARA